MNKLIKPFAFIMALAIPAIASANVELSQVTENEIVVSYNAHMTTTKSGLVELEHQVRLAAEKICGPQNLSRTGDMRRWLENRNCYEQAVANALYSIKTASKTNESIISR